MKPCKTKPAKNAIIDLAVGDPTDPPPECMRRIALRTMASAPACRYIDPRGCAAARGAVAFQYWERAGLEFPADGVVIGNGAGPLVQLALRTADPKTAICGAIAPFYPPYADLIRRAGLTFLPLRLPDGPLTPEAAIEMLGPVAGGVFLFNTPLHNPTGRIFRHGELAAVAEAARRMDVRIIADNPYGALCNPDDLTGSILHHCADAIEIITISKAYRMPGWRCGAAIGNRAWADRIADEQEAIDGVPLPIQLAAAHGWRSQCGVAAFSEELDRRREFMIGGLRELGFRIDTIGANRRGMFVWSRAPMGFASGKALVRALDVVDVKASAGEAFGPGGGGHVRFALNRGAEVLQVALERIRRAVAYAPSDAAPRAVAAE